MLESTRIEKYEKFRRSIDTIKKGIDVMAEDEELIDVMINRCEGYAGSAAMYAVIFRMVLDLAEQSDIEDNAMLTLGVMNNVGRAVKDALKYHFAEEE